MPTSYVNIPQPIDPAILPKNLPKTFVYLIVPFLIWVGNHLGISQGINFEPYFDAKDVPFEAPSPI